MQSVVKNMLAEKILGPGDFTGPLQTLSDSGKRGNTSLYIL